MTDYSEEIAALKEAIATGAKRVTSKDRTVEYDDFDKMMARLRYLEAQNAPAAGSLPPRAGYACFDRGDC
jgi:hypothetical protein